MGILAALAVAMGSVPQEAQDIFNAPRPRDPPDPKDPKGTIRTMKTAADIEVELPTVPGAKPGDEVMLTNSEGVKTKATVLRVDHAMHAIIKAQKPDMNRKQRRQLAHRMQARQSQARAHAAGGAPLKRGG